MSVGQWLALFPGPRSPAGAARAAGRGDGLTHCRNGVDGAAFGKLEFWVSLWRKYSRTACPSSFLSPYYRIFLPFRPAAECDGGGRACREWDTTEVAEHGLN